MAKSLSKSVQKISPLAAVLLLIAIIYVGVNIYFIHRIGQASRLFSL